MVKPTNPFCLFAAIVQSLLSNFRNHGPSYQMGRRKGLLEEYKEVNSLREPRQPHLRSRADCPLVYVATRTNLLLNFVIHFNDANSTALLTTTSECSIYLVSFQAFQ